MKEALKRILTILVKDIKEYWILVFIFISIPLVAFYIPTLKSSDVVKICIASDKPGMDNAYNQSDTKVTYCPLEEGLNRLKAGKADAVISFKDKVVYYGKNDYVLLSKIKKDLQLSENTGVKVEVVNSTQNARNVGYTYVLCAVIVIMVGLIGGPIVFLSEKSGGTLTSLMLSPMTYIEFAISKVIFGFICTFASLSLFLIFIQEISKNTLSLLCMIFVSSLFVSILSGLLSVPFNSVDQMIVISSPLMLVCIFIEVMNMTSTHNFYLPIQNGFKRIIVDGIFPLGQIALIFGISIIILFAYTFSIRRVSRI